MSDKIKVFENKKIRAIWNDDAQDWYFSIVDTCAVLTDSVDPAAYWRKLKQRLKAEGNETVTNCHALKMEAPDGKMRLTDAVTTEQLLRLIQSIPSPKAELILNMLAESATTDIAKEQNPQGMTETAKVAKRGGSVAKAARKEYELQTGKNVVSPLNALDLKNIEAKSESDEDEK